MIDEPAIQPAQVFGIIDPDYARVFTQARIVAWQYGYACLAHGTFTRDLDLLLVPWAEHASREIESIVKHLAGVTGLRLQGPPSDKPHGRKSWSLLFPAFEDVRWVDVSAFAAPVLRTDAATDAAPAAAQQAEPVAWMAFGGSIVHAVTRNAMDPIEAERFDVPLYLHPPAAEVQRLREALEYLIEKCGDSDDAQYSTLGTKFVRDIARRALEGGE